MRVEAWPRVCIKASTSVSSLQQRDCTDSALQKSSHLVFQKTVAGSDARCQVWQCSSSGEADSLLQQMDIVASVLSAYRITLKDWCHKCMQRSSGIMETLQGWHTPVYGVSKAAPWPRPQHTSCKQRCTIKEEMAIRTTADTSTQSRKQQTSNSKTRSSMSKSLYKKGSLRQTTAA